MIVIVAYFNINLGHFDRRSKQFNELVDASKLPHVPYFVPECDFLWCLRWVRVDHLIVRPLSRHDDEGDDILL